MKNLAEAQDALVEAQNMLAQAEIESAEALKISFDCQEQVVKLAQNMIQIGCVSIANSNTVVRTLEAKLEGADKKTLSKLARQELENVVSQIKMQQNIWGKLGQLEDIVQNLEVREKIDAVRDETIIEMMEKEREQDEQLANQKIKTNTHTRQINALQNADAEQDEQIERNTEQIEDLKKADAEQDEQIEEHAGQIEDLKNADEEQDKLIEALKKADEEQDKYLEELKRQDELIQILAKENAELIKSLQKENIELRAIKSDKQSVYISIGIAVVAMILAIIPFFM